MTWLWCLAILVLHGSVFSDKDLSINACDKRTTSLNNSAKFELVANGLLCKSNPEDISKKYYCSVGTKELVFVNIAVTSRPTTGGGCHTNQTDVAILEAEGNSKIMLQTGAVDHSVSYPLNQTSKLRLELTMFSNCSSNYTFRFQASGPLLKPYFWNYYFTNVTCGDFLVLDAPPKLATQQPFSNSEVQSFSTVQPLPTSKTKIDDISDRGRKPDSNDDEETEASVTPEEKTWMTVGIVIGVGCGIMTISIVVIVVVIVLRKRRSQKLNDRDDRSQSNGNPDTHYANLIKTGTDEQAKCHYGVGVDGAVYAEVIISETQNNTAAYDFDNSSQQVKTKENDLTLVENQLYAAGNDAVPQQEDHDGCIYDEPMAVGVTDNETTLVENSLYG